MHKLLIATAALAILTVVSFASAAEPKATHPHKTKSPAPTQQWSWNGLYVGVHAGGVAPKLDITDVGNNGVAYASAGTAGQTFPDNNKTYLAGVQTGWNHQYGKLVYGLEDDLGWLDMDQSVYDPQTTSNTLVGMNPGIYDNLTARLGLGLRRILIYGKGGFNYYRGIAAFRSQSTDYSVRTDSDHYLGTVYGGGIEYQVRTKWNVKAEYLCGNYGTQVFNVYNKVSSGGVTTSVIYPFQEKLQTNTVSLGINYRYKWGAKTIRKHR